MSDLSITLSREETEATQWILARSAEVQMPVGTETAAQAAWRKITDTLNNPTQEVQPQALEPVGKEPLSTEEVKSNGADEDATGGCDRVAEVENPEQASQPGIEDRGGTGIDPPPARSRTGSAQLTTPAPPRCRCNGQILVSEPDGESPERSYWQECPDCAVAVEAKTGGYEARRGGIIGWAEDEAGARRMVERIERVRSQPPQPEDERESTEEGEAPDLSSEPDLDYGQKEREES